jgi:hypothetical protein
MAAKAWSDIRAQRFTAEELRQIDREVEMELLEMDLRTLRGSLEICAIVNGKRVKLAEG